MSLILLHTMIVNMLLFQASPTDALPVDHLLKASPLNALGYGIALAVLAIVAIVFYRLYSKTREQKDEMAEKILVALPAITEALAAQRHMPMTISHIEQNLGVMSNDVRAMNEKLIELISVVNTNKHVKP